MMPVRLEDQDENANHIINNNDTKTKDRYQMKKRSDSERRHYREKSTSTASSESRSSHNRHHHHQHNHQQFKENLELQRTTSSVDSGAGAEDDESGSHTASEENGLNNNTTTTNNNNQKFLRQISDLSSDRQGLSSSSSLSRKTSSKRSKSQSAGDRLSRHHTTASDSAVSTSALSTSGLSTPTESRIFSSPNLSDHSKTSFSPKHSSSSANYPPLTKALRKKQERLKRELDLKETRHQIERQQFIADTYRHHRVSSMKRKDSSKGRAGRSLQKSYSVDVSSPPSATAGEAAPSSKTGERKSKRESRSKSVDPDESRRNSQDGRTSISPRSSIKYKNSQSEINKDKKNNDLMQNASPKSSPTHTTTTATSSTSKLSGEPSSSTVDKDLDNDSNTTNSDKKQRRKSRKDRSSSSRRRRHESLESSGLPNNAANTNDDTKMSTDSDDVFENMAKKLEIAPSAASNEDFENRMKLTVDSILRDGMPDIPSTEQITETGLLDWRAVFRVEMMRLRREVNEFRAYCQKQVLHHAMALGKSTAQAQEQSESGSEITNRTKERLLKESQPPIVADQLRDLQANMKLFQKKQQLLDLETELLSQEERLADKQNHLEVYEKEILEVESMLNHRQAICDRRQKTLLNLDEELQSLRTELEETREQMQVDGSIPESNSERARKNCLSRSDSSRDMLKRNLMDEQKLLETTVQKYRSELASATSTIAGKDILISRLQSVVMQHEEEIGARDKRIKQLESKLSIALSETKLLMDQIPSSSQRDLNTSATESDLASISQQQLQRSGMSSEASLNPDNKRLSSFRTTRSFYRRPSSNTASSDQGDDYRVGGGGGGGGSGGSAGGDGSGGGLMNGDAGGPSRNSFRSSTASRKRNSVSDNAISRLTLSTPRSETSSACVVQ